MTKYIFIIASFLCLSLNVKVSAQYSEIKSNLKSVAVSIQAIESSISSAENFVKSTNNAASLEEHQAILKDVIKALDDIRKQCKRKDELFKLVNNPINESGCNEAIDSYARVTDNIDKMQNSCLESILLADKIVKYDNLADVKIQTATIANFVADIKDNYSQCISTIHSISVDLDNCK